MIERELTSKLQYLATKFPFVALTGARQSGKSTLAEATFPDYRKVSLEDLDMRSWATEDPRGFIASYPDHTILDEVQRVPSLLSYLQTHTDAAKKEGMYILTGSQNMTLMESIDQSLAGRVALLTLMPFSLRELRSASLMKDNINEAIFTGCFPRIYDKGIAPSDYYPNYIKTYIQRDVRELRDIGNLSMFNKFIKLCAGRIGQLLNKSSLAVECGVTVPTIDAWLSILETSCIIYFLRPDYNNFSKRLVKTPKLYFCDTGLACSLLEIHDASQLETHYMRGNLFENMVVSEFLKGAFNAGEEPVLSFWRDNVGHEVDLLQSIDGVQHAYEIKSGATFSADYFKGLNYWSALSGASPDRKSVIYGGGQTMQRSDGKVSTWREL